MEWIFVVFGAIGTVYLIAWGIIWKTSQERRMSEQEEFQFWAQTNSIRILVAGNPIVDEPIYEIFLQSKVGRIGFPLRLPQYSGEEIRIELPYGTFETKHVVWNDEGQ